MRVTTAVMVAAAVVVPVSPAAASCAEPPGTPRPSDYAQAFAGVVERTTNGGGTAEVRVLDVWHGPPLPPRVVVVGGQPRRGVESSVDRTYERGQSYGFFVHRSDDDVLRDNACTATAPLDSLADIDPPGIRPPNPKAAAPRDPRNLIQEQDPLVLAGAGLTAVGVLLLAAAARRAHVRRAAARAD